MSDTEKLKEVLETSAKQRILPKSFLEALSAALDSGLTCDQIAAILLLIAGVKEGEDVWEGTALVERAALLMNSMRRKHPISKEGRDCCCTFNEWRERTGTK